MTGTRGVRERLPVDSESGGDVESGPAPRFASSSAEPVSPGLRGVEADPVGAQSFSLFLEQAGDRAAEVVWQAALVWMQRVAAEGLEGKHGRFRAFPQGELRWLRRELAQAMNLARLAAALQADESDRNYALNHNLHLEAVEAGRRQRRKGTLEAERVRLLRARARAEGRELTSEELYGW